MAQQEDHQCLLTFKQISLYQNYSKQFLNKANTVIDPTFSLDISKSLSNEDFVQCLT